MKNVTTFILFMFLLTKPAMAEEKIKVGLPIALTGDAATWGNDIKNVLFLANKNIYHNKFEFIVEDDQCNPRVGVTAVQKLISVDKVKYIIGLTCSGVTLSAAPIIEKNKVIAISPCSSADAISHSGDYIFRTIPEDREGVVVLHNYLKQNYKSVAVLSEETDYAQGVLNVLQAENHGEITLYTENFLPKVTDNRSALTRLLAKKPDAIFLNPQSDQNLIYLVKQTRELHKSIPILGHVYPSSTTFIQGAGPLAEGIVFANYPNFEDYKSSKALQLKEDFIREFGPIKGVEAAVVSAVDALVALEAAISSGKDPKEYLYANTFQGFAGPFSFDKEGDVVGVSWALKTIRNGLVIPLQ